MREPLTDLDKLLLERWADASGIRDAIKELEDRLTNRLKAVANRLQPWLEDHGYVLFNVDSRYAGVNVAKPGWLKNRDEAVAYISVAALYPLGYRSVVEKHPYVWLMSPDLPEDEQLVFQTEVSKRLKNSPEGWINGDCRQDSPAGRYIRSHGDVERARLAQSEEAMERFIKAELEPMLALGDQWDAALLAAKWNTPDAVMGRANRDQSSPDI